jgi:putative membrane protein
MSIDYLPLMLVNMAAGLVLLAGYVLFGVMRPQQKAWSPAFAAVGAVALLMGYHMVTAWPLPSGSFNAAYGETTVMFGVLFLAAALALAKGWSLAGVSVYGVLAGITAIVLGARIITLSMTPTPVVTGGGFILTGAAGALVAAVLAFRKSLPLRIAVGVMLLASAGLWMFTAMMAHWNHLEMWLPKG